MNENLELLIAKSEITDRWEYDEKHAYDVDALQAAYREEMYTDEGRAIIDEPQLVR